MVVIQVEYYTRMFHLSEDLVMQYSQAYEISRVEFFYMCTSDITTPILQGVQSSFHIVTPIYFDILHMLIVSS